MIFYLYFMGFLMIPSAYRILAGPTRQDRLLGLSLISVEVTLLLCIYAVLLEQSLYLDIAIILALLSFAQITAFLKLHKSRSSS